MVEQFTRELRTAGPQGKAYQPDVPARDPESISLAGASGSCST